MNHLKDSWAEKWHCTLSRNLFKRRFGRLILKYCLFSATSSNHAEILPIHEASRKCVWLRSIVHHIQEDCGIYAGKKTPTIMYEDNATCIAQLKDGYIKGDRTKHILPKFFYRHDLQKSGDVQVLQIRSNDNLADLFTKALPTATFKKLVYRIGLCRLKDLDEYTHKGSNCMLHSFSLNHGFSHWVFLVRFLMRQHFKYFTSYGTIMVIRGSVMNKDGCPL